MSEFGGRADVQQMRVIALVMITVVPGSLSVRIVVAWIYLFTRRVWR
jgi:hypothetical protein